MSRAQRRVMQDISSSSGGVLDNCATGLILIVFHLSYRCDLPSSFPSTGMYPDIRLTRVRPLPALALTAVGLNMASPCFRCFGNFGHKESTAEVSSRSSWDGTQACAPGASLPILSWAVVRCVPIQTFRQEILRTSTSLRGAAVESGYSQEADSGRR